MRAGDREIGVNLLYTGFDQVVVPGIPKFIGDASDFMLVGDKQAFGLECHKEAAEIFHFWGNGHVSASFTKPEVRKDDIGWREGRDIFRVM